VTANEFQRRPMLGGGQRLVKTSATVRMISGARARALGVDRGAILRGDFVVDHTSYDTTSIIATIEKRYGPAPVGSRDAAVADLSAVFEAHANAND
jgi:hypothetical protein